MTAVPLPPRPVALRPLALPVEHGGWGFLLEPIALGLAVAPSWTGALVAVAGVFGFLSRQPLKLALQDAVRGKHYPRTVYCRLLAAGYLLAAGLALAAAILLGGAMLAVPFALVAPLAVVQIVYDARNRSRAMIPEMSGAAAMASIAAALAIAGGLPMASAFGLSGIIIARSLPAILFVRAALRPSPVAPVIAAHALAIALVALYAPPLAIAAMVILLIRAVWTLRGEHPPARTIGWREIVFGAVTVALAAVGWA